MTIDLEAVKAESGETNPEEAAPASESGNAAASGEHAAETAAETVSAGASSDDVPPAPEETAPASGSKPEQPAPASVAASRSGGGALVGGMIGGILALLVAGGLQYSGLLPVLNGASSTDGSAALRDEIAGLQSQIADLRSNRSTPSFDAERQQIAELQATVQSLEAKLQSAGTGSDQSEALAALEQQSSALERTVADLSQRLNAAGATNGEMGARLDAAERELASLRDTVQAAGNAGREAATEAVSGLAGRMDELAGNLRSLTARVDELAAEVARQDEGPKVATVVAASALKSAIDRGAPFASELETYSALAANAAELDPLRPYAESGIPTLATLSEQASKLATEIAAAENAMPESAGLLDRFAASIRSVVTVRPVGEVPGEQPSAIAARMEAAVQRGDLAAALREYEALPENMKALGADFAAKLRARQAADEILDRALSTALKPA